MVKRMVIYGAMIVIAAVSQPPSKLRIPPSTLGLCN
jgi:hypothetical protein